MRQTLLACALSIVCAVPAQAQSQNAFGIPTKQVTNPSASIDAAPGSRAQGWRSQGRSEVLARHGMVATSDPLAAQAGLEILQAGGNAIDAAVAVASTLNVAEPYMSGVGGIGIALVYIAKEGRTRVLNFSGHAPNAAQPEMYDHLNAETGPISPLVPGNVSGWMTMHDTYGSLPLSRVMRDAIQYADKGIALTPFNAAMVDENLVRIDQFETSQKAMVIERSGLSAGSVLRLPQLAESGQ